MKKSSFALMGALIICTVLLGSCSKEESNKTLYLFNWTYYTPDIVIEMFEEEFDVTVNVDSYASNEEMFAKLMAGATGYDMVVPSQDYVSIMIAQDMLEEIDLTKIPNAVNISDLVLAKATYDPTMKYSVPYYMGAAGVSVNTEMVSDYEKSWDIFAREDLSQRMSMMDDMREVMGDALAYLGYSVNTLEATELAEAERLITNEWKPNLVKFDAEGFGKSFAAGDFWVSQGYAEVVFGEVPEAQWDTIDFFIPQEGGPLYIDSMCILKGSKNYDLALEFINFIHRPEIYALFLDDFRFPSSVNTKAGEFVTKKPMYTVEQMEPCEIKDDLGADLATYTTIWERIRLN